jgi:hypothetical protein
MVNYNYPPHACAQRGYVIGRTWCQYIISAKVQFSLLKYLLSGIHSGSRFPIIRFSRAPYLPTVECQSMATTTPHKLLSRSFYTQLWWIVTVQPDPFLTFMRGVCILLFDNVSKMPKVESEFQVSLLVENYYVPYSDVAVQCGCLLQGGFHCVQPGSTLTLRACMQVLGEHAKQKDGLTDLFM